MKVNSDTRNQASAKVAESQAQEASVNARKSGDETQGAPSAALRTSEKVAVSGMARETAKVHGEIKNASDIRKEKVDALKARIAKGDYFVGSGKLADKILQDVVLQSTRNG